MSVNSRPPLGSERPAFAVTLGLLPPYSMDDVKRAYRDKVKDAHPDRGGDRETFDRIQKAFEEAAEYLKFRQDRRLWIAARMDEYVNMAKRGIRSWDQIPTVPDGLRGLEQTRKLDLEDWMDGLKLDAVLFPTVADVGPADADVNPVSADIAWSNGVWGANGNLAIRHLGVPTVTVPMGVMADIGMPVGLTFAGRAYDDSELLRLAAAYEATGNKRLIPPRTPPLG